LRRRDRRRIGNITQEDVDAIRRIMEIEADEKRRGITGKP